MTCSDNGYIVVKKKAGELTTVRDFDGSFIQIPLKYDTEETKECECTRIKRINRMIKSSSITEEFQKMGFGNFDESKVDENVKEMKVKAYNYFLNFDTIKSERENSCLFSGQPGCGKTHLLMAISNNLMQKKHKPVLYFPYKDGINNISANNFEKKDSIMQQMKDVDVLFIDDLFKPIGGKPEVKDWMTAIIFEIINHRYLNKLPILVSTELDFQTLLNIDEALASRIFEMCGDYTMLIPKDINNNWRLRKVMGK